MVVFAQYCTHTTRNVHDLQFSSCMISPRNRPRQMTSGSQICIRIYLFPPRSSGSDSRRDASCVLIKWIGRLLHQLLFDGQTAAGGGVRARRVFRKSMILIGILLHLLKAREFSSAEVLFLLVKSSLVSLSFQTLCTDSDSTRG
jgi:hypothetical protein